MPRRKRSKADDSIGLVAILLAIGFFLIKVLLLILPILIIGGSIYFYFKWQKKKLAEYENDREAFFNHELKPKLKLGLIASPLILVLVLLINQNNTARAAEKLETARIEAENRRIVRERQLEIVENNNRNFERYMFLANENLNKSYYKSTAKYLDSALLIYPKNKEALNLKGNTLFKSKKYSHSAEFYKENIEIFDKGEAYFMIANSYQKLGNKEEAILYAYRSSDQNNLKGDSLYNKLNPLETYISRYTTRCCDGTTSSSSGRGACSHHGGVCKWNDPIYSKRRKYSIK